ncbi:hypothetical protein Y032_0070g446 [Ancylostoma ceylanicum]|uniref:Uncharacterized protein n=1 Tax=Ancylostoma ceylanicum TaxID=53326 RepID=A0A016TXG3_9BILA|nr:hypothetical protein Y032_0070g446 [Ancylostoma ceylanicum]
MVNPSPLQKVETFAGLHLQSGPAMSYYPGEDVEVRAYEAMYNQFGNGVVLDEYIPSQELHHDMVHSDNLVSLQEIQVGLEQLLSDAEDFDSWSGAIRDRMVEKRMSPPTRIVAVHMIFEMAIAVSSRPLSGNNPQHTLARLVSFLCSEIPSLLRDAVLKLLCDFHGKRLSLQTEQRVNLELQTAVDKGRDRSVDTLVVCCTSRGSSKSRRRPAARDNQSARAVVLQLVYGRLELTIQCVS